MNNHMSRRTWRALAPPFGKSIAGRTGLLLGVVVLTGLLATACDVHSPTGPGTLSNLTVTPDVTLAIHGTQQFTAVGTDVDGNVVSITPAWSVVAAGGAISGGGIFTAGTELGVFTATVMATSGGLTGTATVTVIAGPLATIEVTPDPATLGIEEAQQFTAVGRDAGGNVVPVAPTWDVVNGGGSIGADSGLFTAGAVVGTYQNTVRATSGALSGTATVHVVAGPLATIEVTPDPATVRVGRTQQFTAVGRDAGGNVVSISPTWDVVNGGGSIDASSGRFTAGQNTGTFNNTVEATSDGISGTATVEVVDGAVATIEVTPDPAILEEGEEQQFTAVGRDGDGNVVPITPSWAIVNGGGSIDPASGLFTAGTVTGTFNNTVEATSDGISGTATVEVTSAPPPVSPLNSAGDFGILAGAGIECATSGSVTGASTAADIGSSPTLTINGFPPCTFDGAIPAPAVVATAKGDLTAAYLAAQGEVCDLDLTGVDLGFFDSSNPLPPGTYCFSTSVGLTGTLELAGDATDTWTFQIGSTLTADVGSEVILSGGAIPDNVYWAVGSSATLNTDAAFQGNIMSQASISLQADVNLLGRALAQDGTVALIDGGVSIVKP